MSDFRINPPTTSTGGGTPGGNNTDLQYNNSGAFGGFADGTSTQVLHGGRTFSQIVNADIAAATIDLTAKVTGLLPAANAGVAQPTDHPGIFPTQYSAFGHNIIGTANSCVGSNNQVRAVRFVLPFRMAIGRATLTVVATSASQTLAAAIYDIAGTTKLIEFGTFNGASATTQSLTAGPVTLNPGEYWFAYSNSNTAVTVNCIGPNNSLSAIIGATNKHYVSAANAYSSGMPSSLGALTNITSSVNIPLVFFENS